MIICHSRKFIFFSNPKTGSETLRACLAPFAEEGVAPNWRSRTAATPFYPHMSPAEAHAEFRRRGWDWNGYERITCLRDPYARLVSLYRMIVAVDGIWRRSRRLGLPNPSFARWLRRSRPDGRGGGGRAHQRWRRYGAWSGRTWCRDSDGRMAIDTLLRLENIDAEFQPLARRLGLGSGPLPVVNSRPPVNLSGWYSPELSRLVASRYAWDLAHYDAPESCASSSTGR